MTLRTPPAIQEPSKAQRWRGRPVLGWITRTVVFLGPVLVGIVTSAVLVRVLDQPSSGPALVAWWMGVLIVSTGVLYGADRLFRRLLPLVTLFRLTVLFPDRAPSRFGVARRGESVEVLQDRLEGGWKHRGHRDSTAAEQILALVAALDDHDKRTRGHSERTAQYADMLAQEMKLSPASRDRLRWAALLHDVGKLFIPAETLNNKGTPDEEAWIAILRHPQDGALLAEPLMDWLGDWGRAIAEHHERLDGSGYPLGLSGSEISLSARIVAVADAYETMTAGRPYRKPLSSMAARKEIADHSGTRYDPRVCRALMSISLGRSRRAFGIFGLGQLPLALGFDRIGQAATAVVQTAGSATVAAAGALALVAAGIFPGQSAATDGAPSRSGPGQVLAIARPVAEPDASPVTRPDATPKPRGEATPKPRAEATPVPAVLPKALAQPIAQVPVVTFAPCDAAYRIKASKDAWIVNDKHAPNHGGDTTLVVRSKFSSGLKAKATRTLIAFDLPTVGAGCEITDATLRLYALDADTSRTIEVRPVSSAWDERDVLWSDQPAFTGPAAGSRPGLGWRTWDVAPIFESASVEHGFVVKDTAEGTDGLPQSYASSESAQHAPELVIEVGEG
jgi:putative nucleotidyltransferase with HDIG domain